jgi:ribonuclease-3
MNNIEELLKNLHIKPKNIDLYRLALTHSSYNGDANTKHHDYERLEYIGDAVIGFVVADLIFNLHGNMEVGIMSKLRSQLVQTKALAGYARRIKLYDYILTGSSMSSEKLYNSDNILEDVFEALVGALYLDLGIKKVFPYIKFFFYNDIKFANPENFTDYKTRLQEEMQSEFRDIVKYRIVKEEGPPHDRIFYAEVLFGDDILGEGSGRSKKEAEQAAAKDAFRKKVG